MTVVWPCQVKIEVYLRVGRRLRPPVQPCPGCKRPLKIQGGYTRQLRYESSKHELWVWRAYCQACDVSHALLPDFIVAYHLDTTDTIFRAIDPTVRMDLPGSTRRGWRARFRRNLATLESACAAATVAFGGEVPRVLRIDLLIVALWQAIRRRTECIGPPWRF